MTLLNYQFFTLNKNEEKNCEKKESIYIGNLCASAGERTFRKSVIALRAHTHYQSHKFKTQQDLMIIKPFATFFLANHVFIWIQRMKNWEKQLISHLPILSNSFLQRSLLMKMNSINVKTAKSVLCHFYDYENQSRKYLRLFQTQRWESLQKN